MTKIKKQPKDMTTEEIADAVFPKKLHKKLKELIHGLDDKTDSNKTS